MSTDVSGISKHFPSAENGFTTTTSGSVSSGAATVGLNSVAGYTDGETVVFVIDPTNAAKKQTFTGVMDTSGVQVTGVVWTAGTNVAHDSGATVVDYATATHISMMTKGLLRDHNQSGYHKTLNDDSGNEWIKQVSTASAVNELSVANAATGNSPILSATGGDTNVGLTLTPKGTGNISMTSRADGWVTGLTAPNTVTANGNRSYDMVFNTLDYTDRLSPGMRLKLTRTVTAPTQCTDLESGSSQYYKKTTPNKLTFTDDFVCSAWVKLESYISDGAVVSRYSAGNGWILFINSSGQIILAGYNAGIGNNSRITSYQSLPLNRWVHIAVQLDMSTFTATTTTSYVMIDGVDVPAVVARTGTNPTALIQGGDLEVGSFAGGNFFDGKLAQVAVYSAKVTQATILASMHQTLSGSETSLASAYSFNNSITDLNTTTPNDLTAQGSAVATNADSPFALDAQGVPVGTTEYAVITKTAFSTNTTLTVQVPEGSAIPTSGGVSALSYSTQDVPLGFVNAKSKYSVFSLFKTSLNTSIGAVNTWYPSLGYRINSVPVGLWNIGFRGVFRQDSTVSGGRSLWVQMASTAPTNSVYNGELVGRGFTPGSPACISTFNIVTIYPISHSVATGYIMYGAIDASTGTETWGCAGGEGSTYLFADCAYI